MNERAAVILPLFHGHLDKRSTIAIKPQALARAAKEGVPAAAHDFGLEPAQLCAWREKVPQQGESVEQQRLMQSELDRLKRELTRTKDEVALLKNVRC